VRATQISEIDPETPVQNRTCLNEETTCALTTHSGLGATPEFDRDQLAKRMAEAGVGSKIFHPRLIHDDGEREPSTGRAGQDAVRATIADEVLLPARQHLSGVGLVEVVEAAWRVLR
jgi:hypothetical protein